MPGYVFFDADTEPAWNRILKDSAVLKLLSYGDGEYALRGTDLEFIDWIKKNNGIIEMSSAVKVGSMIEFVAGPLKDMNGKIIKINRSRRQVQVSFGSENGIISKVWCNGVRLQQRGFVFRREREQKRIRQLKSITDC